MKIIKDNSKKEYKTRCKKCKSKFSYNAMDVEEAFGDIFKIKCPICGRYKYL